MEVNALISRHNEAKDLFIACNIGNLPNVQGFIRLNNISQNIINEALWISCARNYLDITKYLISEGADIHANDDYALYVACFDGNILIVQYLISIGSNVNAYSSQRNTRNPFITACAYDKVEVVKYLLTVGANIHMDDDDALLLAAKNNYLSTVQCLLAAGANVHAQYDGSIGWASMKGYTDMCGCLLAAGADISRISWEGFDKSAKNYMMQFIRKQHFKKLPNSIKPIWIRHNLRTHLRLRRWLDIVRTRLESPPRVLCGKSHPTRDDII